MTTGTEASSDTPLFTVQNAQGFDAGQAEYTFVISTAGRGRNVATSTVAAGSRTTPFTPAGPLPRATSLVWEAIGRSGAGATSASLRTPFRSRAVDCVAGGSPYGKAVVGFFLTACSLARNRFNDPREVLGPPNSNAPAPDYNGFMSLGEGGHVVVDMEACAADRPGPDVRVWQRTSREPVTLHAAGRPDGPFVLLQARVDCGPPTGPIPAGAGHRSGYCDFDLADTEMQEARYFKIEDGELYPCAQAGTDTEGADIDAIEILNRKQ